jgi:hypothetical protein
VLFHEKSDRVKQKNSYLENKREQGENDHSEQRRLMIHLILNEEGGGGKKKQFAAARKICYLFLMFENFTPSKKIM